MSPRLQVSSLALALGLAAASAGAQPASVTLTTLPPASATLAAEFTSIAGVRELADGRVIIVDFGDKAVFVGDWSSRAARRLGHAGGGPGEYIAPGTLFPLPADSTLLVDLMAGRWLLLHGDSIVQTVSADAPAIRAGARSPLGANAAGEVLTTVPLGGTPGARAAIIPPRIDSVLVIRVRRAAAHVDTIARMRTRPARISVQGPAEHPTAISVMINPLAAGEQALLFSDGWAAIARLGPYRVDWVSPSGQRVSGAPLPFERASVTDREKRAILARRAAQLGQDPREPSAVPDWPDILPPFLSSALLAAPDGRLWIERTPSADHPDLRYDIVDRRGALVARLALGRSEKVIGLGRGTVYTVFTDDDGIQRLRRHVAPRF